MLKYTDLQKFNTYEERLKALRVKTITHSIKRDELNAFYKSREWIEVREFVIARDMGFDMGLVNEPISGKVIVHHIDPITDVDILTRSHKLLDPENLITVSHETHNLIHYGGSRNQYVERKPGDTKWW